MIAVKPGTCGAHEASCFCIHEAGHEGLHECTCNGAWEYLDGKFAPRRFPCVGAYLDERLDEMTREDEKA